MAAMDIEKVLQDLNTRFAAPLPEFYKRRIIFWHDEENEFSDKIADISLDDAKILILTGTNNFAAKKLLNEDDTGSNYLVYCPIVYASDEENWLLDAELYSEQFRADLFSIWMDEMGAAHTPQIRSCFKKYRKFLNAKDRRRRVISLGKGLNKPAEVQLAIMTVLCGIRDAKPEDIIRTVLENGLGKEENSIYQEFVNYEIDEAFWRMVRQGTGYQEDDPDLGRLASHILLTATTRTMRAEILAGLDSFISTAHQAYCYDLVSDWLHSDDMKKVREIAADAESEAKLPQRFMKLTIADLIEMEVFPCVDEVILVKLMRDIANQIINVDLIRKTIENRRTCVWYSEFGIFYDGLLQVANMQAFYLQHADGFHTVEPKKVWQEYTSEYFKMDTFYREFQRSYDESLKNYNPDLSDLFSSVRDQVEGLYTNWFLGKLGNNWSDACADNLRDYGRILDIPQQTDFYRRRIKPSDSRSYVIISDAMRYEVAVQLASELQQETQSKVTISSMEGIFPTITKFGMAALLPHGKLSVELKSGKTDRLAILADGQSTEANNRDNLLKYENPNSVALKYKDIIGMKRAERQALVRGMNVVYIYHDTIDEAGHLEKSIFGACDETIGELKNMVRIITNEFGGANILITSDHGFLYTASPLKEDNKVDKTTESDQDIEIGRRYAIMQKGAKPEYMLPVRFLDGDTPYDAFAPRENVRIKMKGAGMNFVHGGISLQEMVVPVIEYHFLRNDSKEYQKNKGKYDTKAVTISLYSASHKISNMIFSLNFYQAEPVSSNREAAVYNLYFTDSEGKPVSDVSRIIADKTSQSTQERTFRVSFNLKSMKYKNTDPYYLVIADENGLPVAKEEFQIDIAFATDDFDFFS